jgi:hypothetical protein
VKQGEEKGDDTEQPDFARGVREEDEEDNNSLAACNE